MRYSNRTYKKPREESDDAYVKIQVFVPKSIAAILEETSYARQQPLSKLVAIAVYNELETEVPFYFDSTIPNVQFVENQYAKEATMLLDFLTRIGRGIGLDQIIMCRRDIGFPSKDVTVLAYRELLKAKLIEEYYPKESRFKYHKSQLWTRLFGSSKEVELKNNRRIKGPLHED